MRFLSLDWLVLVCHAFVLVLVSCVYFVIFHMEAFTSFLYGFLAVVAADGRFGEGAGDGIVVELSHGEARGEEERGVYS